MLLFVLLYLVSHPVLCNDAVCQVRFFLGDDRDKEDDSCVLMMLGILGAILERFVKNFIRFGSKVKKL